MTIAPEQALQKAVVAALSADAALTALIGADAIYDRLVDGGSLPYLVIGAMTTTDWSTATETGSEHVFTLEAWSKEPGKREVQAIAAAVRAILHDRPLALEAGTLVNLRLGRVRTERMAKQRLHRATLTFRAVIES